MVALWIFYCETWISGISLGLSESFLGLRLLSIYSADQFQCVYLPRPSAGPVTGDPLLAPAYICATCAKVAITGFTAPSPTPTDKAELNRKCHYWPKEFTSGLENVTLETKQILDTVVSSRLCPASCFNESCFCIST